jgi:ParB-like chromosome segregation protein Spo0J
MSASVPTETKKTIIKYEVAGLQANPRQAALFGPPRDGEIEALAGEMGRDGQLVPVEILPGGVLITGHKRTAAARRLGWRHVDAWIREDLAAQGEAAVERRMIEDNQTRRHLDPLSLVRCALRLKQLEMSAWQGRLTDREKGEVRERIGQRLGLSGRHVGRHLRVAELAPAEVQHAVSAGRLAMADALAVTCLSPADREEIARRLREGADPREVLGQFIAQRDRRHKKVKDAKKAFIRALARGLDDLAERVEQVPWVRPDEHLTLRRAQHVIGKLLAQAERQVREEPDYVAALEQLVGGDDVEGAHAAGEATDGAAAPPDTMSGPKKKRPKPRRARA